MGWTYSVEDLATDPMMQVRLLIGDTNENDQQMQDEELAHFLLTEGSTNSAASQAAYSLAARYARKADKKMGDLSINYSKVSENYRKLAEQLIATGVSYAVPTAGGVYKDDRNRAQDDPSTLKSSFKRGMHDFVTDSTRPNSQD